MANTSWSHAAEQVRKGYSVWGKGYWGGGVGSEHSGSNSYHKARAKLLFGNILTLGLVNVGLMIGVKRNNERKQLWESSLQAKVRQFAVMAHEHYELDEGDFIRYFKYKLLNTDKPQVRPSTNTQFARGWKRFIADNRTALAEARLDWWE